MNDLNTESAEGKHRERRGKTQRAQRGNTESAEGKHRERRGETQRAQRGNTESAEGKHRERRGETQSATEKDSAALCEKLFFSVLKKLIAQTPPPVSPG